MDIDQANEIEDEWEIERHRASLQVANQSQQQ